MSESNYSDQHNPAYPIEVDERQWPNKKYFDGLSKREYAAIILRVPDSGEEWLDGMINEANKKNGKSSLDI